jgi:TonB family protein
MGKISLSVLVFTFASVCFGQSVETKYYSDRFLQKEVPVQKSKFSKIVQQNQDGSTTTSRKNLKKDEIFESETFKGDEPWGIWIHQIGVGLEEMDFNFLLQYSKIDCSSDPLSNKIKNYFEDNADAKFTAPRIDGYETINLFVARNMRYPAHARRMGIEGKVLLTFKLTKEGTIENIVVNKGVEVGLDKEAVRVLRKLKLASPALLEGQPRDFCVSMPLTYNLM